MFFKLSGGDIIQDDVTLPRPEGVEWRTLFKVSEVPAYCAAPVFPDAASAVRWLRIVAGEKRRYPWYTRASVPDFIMAHGSNPLDIDVSDYGLGVADNYGDLASRSGFIIPTFLYRGQEDFGYPLLPTLARSLWPPVGLGRGSFREAVEANESEQRCTHYFTKKFFSKWSVRRQFEWTKRLSVPRRAAITRHHGFYSWIIDYSLEPGIAAWFASGGARGEAPKAGVGLIQVVDEHRLSKIFGAKAAITNHQGYQQRSWLGIDIETVLKNTPVHWGKEQIGSLVAGEFWSGIQKHERALTHFCCHLLFTPGREVNRMWHQKWCGVEAICEDYSWRQIITAYQVLARITETVLFHQNGTIYEEAESGITRAHLLPDDEFATAIDEFSTKNGLHPGSFTRAFLSSALA